MTKRRHRDANLSAEFLNEITQLTVLATHLAEGVFVCHWARQQLFSLCVRSKIARMYTRVHFHARRKRKVQS